MKLVTYNIQYSKGQDGKFSLIRIAEAEMAGRTPTVLMARELFFRTCEFSVNYQLSKEEAFNLFKETLTTVNSLAIIQANNTTITVGDTVTTTTTNAEGVSVRNQTGEVVPPAAE